MAHKRLIVMLVGALVLVLAVAGCGSSDDDDEVAASSISKAEYTKQADEVCKKGEKQFEEDFTAYFKEHQDIQKPTEDDYAELVEVVLVPNVEEELDNLRALGAPEDDVDQITALLQAREESLEAAEAEPKLVVNDSDKVFGESRKLSQKYGFKVCGSRY